LRMASALPARRPGLPPIRRRARAALSPDCAFGDQRRSSWATAPSTCRENMPCGGALSIGSRRLRKCARLAPSITESR
jgi:hypothetical protein